jgi:hypothetical protein
LWIVDNDVSCLLRGHLVVLAMSTVLHRLVHRLRRAVDERYVVHRDRAATRALVHRLFPMLVGGLG